MQHVTKLLEHARSNVLRVHHADDGLARNGIVTIIILVLAVIGLLALL